MVEQSLVETAKEVKKQIKFHLLERDMTQVELAELIGEGVIQVNRAISGDMSPKSVNIRKKIYRVLDME
ncbi:transcriptional regulator [Liquorilactobacillus satsumensis]|uniref:transcriptional regulator n=1 Tax=Liquorilactobacillus TaxID=2767888 RepID=UPI001E33727D|nr:transcriptional regulator [Liquorilactobacillus satsumensis]MCC7667471.1 transcriptional regulator [Liquorilactobacillus satsumensis]MCP9357941.1 transcriptional regulator [Liquorilactobacillus satsumensis]MCP9371631.1 transcriptional regulator [Liquorilactobacillus satsumensis]